MVRVLGKLEHLQGAEDADRNLGGYRECPGQGVGQTPSPLRPGQAAELGAALGMGWVMAPARRLRGHQFGNALLGFALAEATGLFGLLEKLDGVVTLVLSAPTHITAVVVDVLLGLQPDFGAGGSRLSGVV